jgi:muramoyltetrapeptide carboxypeptidase
LGILKLIQPAPLRAGGSIGICAPSGPVKPERLSVAIDALRAQGFRVETAPSVFSQHGFLAAPDEVRARDMMEMFARDDIQAVFCTRGGTGVSRLFELLDTESIARARKPFLGFSDVTALQWLLAARHGLVTFSGPLAVEFDGAITERTQKQAFAVLAGPADTDLLGDLPRENIRVLRGAGRLTGPLFPGNLTLITTLLGTPYLPDLTGAILMIEDVGEPPYRIDRLLFHLRNAGIFHRISALLVGDFGSTDDSEHEMLESSLWDATRGFTFPLVVGFPYGHGAERMTLPVGAPVELMLNPSCLSLRSTSFMNTTA